MGYLLGPIGQTGFETKNKNISNAVDSGIPNIESNGLEEVVRVIDGDTIEIKGGVKIRYIGINTPESVAPGKKVECFAKEAAQKNKELVLGKKVFLEKDVSETDKYGRLLRYVYVVGDNSAESDEKSLFINDYLVKYGYAQVSTYPPDVRYQDKFLESQRYAAENRLGLWSGCVNM